MKWKKDEIAYPGLSKGSLWVRVCILNYSPFPFLMLGMSENQEQNLSLCIVGNKGIVWDCEGNFRLMDPFQQFYLWLELSNS